MITSAEIMVGKVYGRLTVTGIAPYRDKSGELLMKCLCSCGTETVKRRDRIKAGKVKSCGCLLREMWHRGDTLRVEEEKAAIVPITAEPARIELDATMGAVAGLETVNRKLSDRERLCCDSYLVSLDKTAAFEEIYRVNPADPKTRKDRLRQRVNNFFSRPAVKDYIEAAMRKKRERYDVNLQNVMREQTRIAMSTLKELCQVKDGKLYITDTEKLSDEAWSAIAKLKQTKEGIEVTLHGKNEAARLVAEHLGGLPKKVEFTGRMVVENTDVKKLSNEQLKAIAKDPRVVLAAGSNN